jgi:hypothetical protein
MKIYDDAVSNALWHAFDFKLSLAVALKSIERKDLEGLLMDVEASPVNPEEFVPHFFS